MFSAIRTRIHLTPSTVIATLALVFAMTGGAYAASKYVITSTKQISPKVLKALAGKTGKNGANGAQGPAGPAGAAGAKGENGAPGTNGTNGKDGVSVTSTVLAAKNANCKEGGSEFTSASGKTYACNGKEGKEGTFGGQTLPAGKTLTGAYAASTFSEAPGEPGFVLVRTGVSFALPLEISTTQLQSHYIKVTDATPPGCKGNASEPGAEPGNLCVFSGGEPNVSIGVVNTQGSNVSSYGFIVAGLPAAKGAVAIEGTWAVTG
jgi:hypothetical protein